MKHNISDSNIDYSKNKAASAVSIAKDSKSNPTKIVLNLKKRDKSELTSVKNSAYTYLTL